MLSNATEDSKLCLITIRDIQTQIQVETMKDKVGIQKLSPTKEDNMQEVKGLKVYQL